MAGAGLVPVDDPKAWTLWREHDGGTRHVWEHKATGWLSQTLTVPRRALAHPESALEWSKRFGKQGVGAAGGGR